MRCSLSSRRGAHLGANSGLRKAPQLFLRTSRRKHLATRCARSDFQQRLGGHGRGQHALDVDQPSSCMHLQICAGKRRKANYPTSFSHNAVAVRVLVCCFNSCSYMRMSTVTGNLTHSAARQNATFFTSGNEGIKLCLGVIVSSCITLPCRRQPPIYDCISDHGQDEY